MKILVANRLNPKLSGCDLGEQVIYRPELAVESEDALCCALRDYQPDAALVDNKPISPETLTTWRQVTQGPIRLVQRQNGHHLPKIELPGVAVEQIEGKTADFHADIAALGIAERNLMQHQVADKLAACGISLQGSAPSTASVSGSRAILVGAGIVNLITAYELIKHDIAVEILDAGPDPRSKPNWQQLGATHGGGNARMFCFTEANNYNEKENRVDACLQSVMQKRILDGGWLAISPEQMSAVERAWIRNHCSLPRWRAEVFTQDIHRFNVTSKPLWERIGQDAPHLFENVGYRSGILRIYSQVEAVEAARLLYSKLGSLERLLDLDRLKQYHPAFCEAALNGEIAGAMEIVGFTLNIHPFVEKLLFHLETRGVNIRWNLPAIGIERNGEGHASGLRTLEGVFRADHYVLSPGVYGESLLQGTRSAGKVQGILGLWLNLPNLDPQLRRSVKIHREGHVGEDSNVTIAMDHAGRPMLILGSGYGFIGHHPIEMDSPDIDCLFQALEKTAKRFFPSAYQQAVRAGTLYGDRKACVRPFTSTGLGIFEVEPTAAGGRLAIATGHNTGGFTQAPVVAEAVAATLSGQYHPMQALYHPERGIVASKNVELEQNLLLV